MSDDTATRDLIESRVRGVFAGLSGVKFDIDGHPRITLDDLSACMGSVVEEMLHDIQILIIAGFGVRNAVDGAIEDALQKPSRILRATRVEAAQVVRQLMGNRYVVERLENAARLSRNADASSRRVSRPQRHGRVRF